MVQVRPDYVTSPDGRIEFDTWFQRIEQCGVQASAQQLEAAFNLAQEVEQQAVRAKHVWASGVSSFQTGLEMAEILAQLHLDGEALVAAILYRCVRESRLPLEEVKQDFGDAVAKLVQGVLRMAAINETDTSRTRVLGQSREQLENVRQMLLAMVDDVRVALLKLAERTCAIRYAKYATEEKRKRVAREVFDIYAPLAHRLGIGQLKWELEDLSFRYLQEENYKRIAHLIDERRVDREKFIDEVSLELRRQLDRANIDAEVIGRVKSIYSIWRKMQSKHLDFAQIYDIRALRILVPNVRDCYTTLGIVHSLWRVIPNEFDDYIANPKQNGYQSLHTAVIYRDGRVFEIQIRTYAMDEDAELGVCAHWRYKEGIMDASHRSSYDDKIEWLRQVLAWHDEMGMVGGLAQELRSDSLMQDRIYVFTPEGHVVDLQKGATPLDFAYYVHTEIGHTCTGAKVNDKFVPLNYQLQTGDRVEVLSEPGSQPRRAWLKQSLGYINTPRARAKLVQWFKEQSKEANIAYGKSLLQNEFSLLGVTDVDYRKLVRKLGSQGIRSLFASVGTGAIQPEEVLAAAQEIAHRHGKAPTEGEAGLNKKISVRISIKAWDRPGLLRDVSSILAGDEIEVIEINTRSDRAAGTALMQLEIEVESYSRLLLSLEKLNHLNKVIEARRIEGEQ